MQRGETHSERYETSPTLIRMVQADPNLQLVTAPGVWVNYMQFNTWRVGDPVVRRAIAHACDKEDMINSAMLGWGTIEHGVVTLAWHPDFVSDRVLPGGNLNYEYNITKANMLLDEAGYLDTDDDGIREIPPDKQDMFKTGATFENPDGTGVRDELRFTVRSLAWFLMSHKPTEILAGEVPKIGIKFDVSGEESTVLYPAIDQHMDYDIWTCATGEGPDFSTVFDEHYGPESYSNGANVDGYSNAHYDELWQQVYTLPYASPEHRAVIHEMQEIVNEECLWINWYTGDDTHVLNSNFAGYTVMPGGIITDYNIWTIIGLYNMVDRSEGFRIGYPGPVMNFNPLITGDWRSVWWETLIYDNLVALDPQLNVVPWLAESYSVSEDGLDWTFTIRDGVKWHDGKDFTPEDVLWNLAYCYDNKVAKFWPWVKSIDRATLRVDGNDVKFSLTQPNSWFILKVFAMKLIAPHTYPEGQDHLIWEDPHPIGTGPFMYDSHVEGQTWKAVRNPNWWYDGVDPPFPGELPTGPQTTIVTLTGTATTVITSVVPEFDASFLMVPVVILGFIMFHLARKRK